MDVTCQFEEKLWQFFEGNMTIKHQLGGTSFSDRYMNYGSVGTFLNDLLFRGRYTNMRMIGAGQFGTAGLPSFHQLPSASISFHEWHL